MAKGHCLYHSILQVSIYLFVFIADHEQLSLGRKYVYSVLCCSHTWYIGAQGILLSE